MATKYTYDTASRLDELKLEFAAATNNLISKFHYNPASQIAKNERSNVAYSWTGHGSGTTVATTDGVAQSANGLNQIGSWVTSLGYDPKGNLTSDGSYSYTYSSENLLTSLANSAPGAAQPNIAFAYDPLMRLASIDSTVSGFDVEFGYDGQEMVVEALSAGRTRRYVHGPGTDEPLVAYLVTPGFGTTRVWYQADERGSIVRTSLDSGAPTSAIGRYDEYGAGGTGRYRYTGQYWLGEANLLYYRARVYDPRLGRFLQPDPIGYGDGMNMYAYVGGDPMNSTDASGLCADGQNMVTDTGSRISRCVDTKSGDNGGVGGSYSGFSTAGVGGRTLGAANVAAQNAVGIPGSPGSPGSVSSSGDSIIITARSSGSMPWTSADFINHYIWGNGSTVRLQEVGLGGFLEKDPSVEEVTSNYISLVVSVRVAEFRLPFRQIGVSHLTSRLFALGDSAVYGESSCLKTLCFFRFSIQDSFEDPLDLGFEIPGGTPYGIQHEWSIMARRRGGW